MVVGRGKLANELLEGLSGDAISRVVRWEDRPDMSPGSNIVVHAGSGREMAEVIDHCAKTNSILFELSTSGALIPETVTFPVIICPNVNLQMLYFMAMVKQFSGISKAGRSGLPSLISRPRKRNPEQPFIWQNRWAFLKVILFRNGTLGDSKNLSVYPWRI